MFLGAICTLLWRDNLIRVMVESVHENVLNAAIEDVVAAVKTATR